MKPKTTYNSNTYIFLILMLFTFVASGQQITRMDFGFDVHTTPGNWNNATVQNVLGTAISLIDVTGAPTGEILTLTDVFDRYERNGDGTLSPTGFPFLTKASRDSFFGESVAFDNGGGPSTETTGGFTLSGLEIGKFYSFTIFASRMGVTDNRETLYTITGNSGAQTATLNVDNNTSNVATILNVQPDGSGKISIQATTGPNNTNPYGFYYLGAIEMTKTTFRKTVTWNGTNWIGGTPSLNTPVRIAGHYNTIPNGSFKAFSMVVDPSFLINISDGTFVEVQNDVTIDGTIRVQTRGNFVQNDSGSTFSLGASGTAQVRKETPPKAKWYYYTYWSSPVVGETIGNVFPDVDGDRRFSFNAANFVDTDGDDIDDTAPYDWHNVLAGDPMLPGVGYAVTEARLHMPGGTGTANFEGAFNTRDVPVGIVYNPLNTLFSWNFIGNPYPSAIDFEAFYLANSGVVEGLAYFWSQATPPSSANPGNQQLNFSLNDYAVYSFGLHDGTVGGAGIKPTQYIPSCQGFFIPSITNGTATFTNAMRMADISSNSQFFKSSNVKNKAINVDDKLWVNLTSDNGVFGQILVGYVEGATNGIDRMAYDAPRASSETPATLYWTIEGSNKKFVIQGKDANSINNDEVIKLGFKTSIKVATLYTISIDQVQGAFLTGNTVYLKDNLLNKLHDLSASDYTFTSETGEFNTRFEIVFNANALSTGEFISNKNSLSIVELNDDQVQFSASDNLKIKSVSIFDLSGRQLYNFKGQNSTETYRLSNLSSTVYIAKVTLSNGALITKKALKK